MSDNCPHCHMPHGVHLSICEKMNPTHVLVPIDDLVAVLGVVWDFLEGWQVDDLPSGREHEIGQLHGRVSRLYGKGPHTVHRPDLVDESEGR